MIDNPMNTGLQAHQERREAWEQACADAYDSLRAQFTTALFCDTTTVLPTPSYLPSRTPCIEVVWGLLEPTEAGSMLDCLMRLLTTCAEGEDPATRLPAAALLARMAHHYADTHASDQAIAEQDQ